MALESQLLPPQIILNVTITDTATVSDQVTVTGVFNITITDTVTTSDQTITRLPTLDTTNLEAYYKFEETSGQLKNSNNTNIFPQGNSSLIVGVDKVETGLIGNAWRFDGTFGQRIGITGVSANAEWLFLGSTQMSANFWIRNASFGVTSQLVDTTVGNPRINGAELRCTNTDEFNYVQSNAGGTLENERSPQNFCINNSQTYVMYTFVRNGTSIEYHRDGVLFATDTTTGSVNITTTNFPIFGNLNKPNPSGFPFPCTQCTMDEWSFWSIPLSGTEISDLYNDGFGLELQAPVNVTTNVNIQDVVIVVNGQVSLSQPLLDITDLEGYYKFEETSGNVRNEPITNLFPQGNSSVATVTSKVNTGLFGNAWRFGLGDPLAESITLTGINANNEWNFTNSNMFSANFWIKGLQHSGTAMLFDSKDFGGSALNGINLQAIVTFDRLNYVQGSPTVTFRENEESANDFFENNDPSFSMYTFVRNGTSIQYYKNGTLFDTDTTAFNESHPLSTNFPRFGNLNDASNSRPLEGAIIDEWSFWSIPLSGNEVSILFNNGFGLELDNQTLAIQMVFNQTETDTATVLDQEQFNITKLFSDITNATDQEQFVITKLFSDTTTILDAEIISKNPVPNAINDLDAFAVGNSCELTWTTPVNLGLPLAPINGYGIFSSVDGGLFIPIIANTSNTDTAFNHTGLNAFSTYLYNVTSFSIYGTSLSSNIDSCVPQAGSDPPSIPTGLTAVNQGENVFLDWDHDGVGNPTGYKIERALGDGAFFDLVSNTADTSTNFLDNTVDPATKYRYRISAINAFGTSDPSQIATITTLFPPEQPTLTAVQDGNMITLTWTQPTSDEPINGYTIDRRINFGSLSTLIANTTTTSLTFDDLNVTKPNVFGYRVNAISILGAGTVSNIVDVVFGSHTTVIVEEQDGSGYKGGGTVRLQNSTFTLDQALDSGSTTTFDNLDSGNYNFTFIDEDNFILNKTFNFPHPTGNQSNTFTISALVFDVDCPSAGTGTDVRIKVNYTDGKDITEYPATPVCDSSDKVSWSVRWQGDAGVDMSTMIADFISNTFKTNADTFLVSAIQTDTIYNAPLNQIESVDYVVNNNVTTTDVTINFDLFLGQAPPSGGSGGSGGGGTPPAGASIPELKIELLQRLTGLSVLSRTHTFASAGDVIEGSISVEWEGEAPLTVKNIDVGEFSNIIRFELPPILLAQSIEGSGDFAKSSAEIPYIITLPPFICDEMLGITQNCVNEELISMPVAFVFESEGVDYTASTSVMVDLRPIPFDLPQFQIILLGIVLIVSAIAGNFIRSRIRGKGRGKKISKRARTKKFKKKFDSS